jgi:hypothetical protein
MSSTLRHIASLRLPDQNTSRKCTHAWINDDNFAWLTFSCQSGVYELVGDSALTSAEDILDADNYTYDGVFACKYMGGLRVVTDFGDNMKALLRSWLGYDSDAPVTVLLPGVASRVLMIDNRWDGSGFNTEAVIEGSYSTGFLSDSAYLNRNADTWMVKEPLVFSIDGDEFFYVNPIGDDVYSHNYEPYDEGSRSVTPTMTLAAAQKKVRSVATSFRPRNAGAKARLMTVANKILAKAAPSV